MSNKEKILKTALKLFNQGNLKSITTNKIAKESGVSTGNLYYHFKDKEEIVRHLFLEMAEQEESVIAECAEYSLEGLNEYFEKMLKVYWEYRFLKREMMSALSQDELLKPLLSEYVSTHEKAIQETIFAFIDSGLLCEIPPQKMDHLAKSILLQLLFYIPYLEMKSIKITKQSFQECVEMIFSTIGPYLRE